MATAFTVWDGEGAGLGRTGDDVDTRDTREPDRLAGGERKQTLRERGQCKILCVNAVHSGARE